MLQLVQNQVPPGRFLVREGDVYRQAPGDKVLQKIRSALKEPKWEENSRPRNDSIRVLREQRTQKSKRPKHQLFDDEDQVDPNPNIVPYETDVLFVQGSGVAAWPGNTNF